MQDLEQFIIAAKAACYIGGSGAVKPCRPGAHDLAFQKDTYRYLDSYFGGTDFLGQEVVWYNTHPVWAMNYYGYIVQPDDFNAKLAGGVIVKSLAALYAQGRFLGAFSYDVDGYTYVDKNQGDVQKFHGIETISRGGIELYRLEYHGGCIRD